MDSFRVDVGEICKVLANPTRLRILELLKDPQAHFDRQKYTAHGLDINDGVCVQDLQNATGLSQSVTSTFLKGMQAAGLLTSHRAGRWTYYRRNEEALRAFADAVRGL